MRNSFKPVAEDEMKAFVALMENSVVKPRSPPRTDLLSSNISRISPSSGGSSRSCCVSLKLDIFFMQWPVHLSIEGRQVILRGTFPVSGCLIRTTGSVYPRSQ